MIDDIQSLEARIAPYFSGCPSAMRLEALRQAWRDLCIEGLVWRVPADNIPLVAGERAYQVVVDPDAFIQKITAAVVLHEGRIVRRLLPFDDYLFAWSSDAELLLQLTWTPNEQEESQGYEVGLLAALKPSAGDVGTEARAVINHYDDAIEARAMAILYGMEGSKWANANKAAEKQAAFRKRVVEALATMQSDHGGEVRV